MLEVLHVYSGNRFGGIEMLLLRLNDFKSEAPEMEPSFALFFDGKLARKLRDAKADVALLGDVRLSRPWTAMRAQISLARRLKLKKPQLLVCHEPWAYAIAAPISKAMRIPIVLWCHNPFSGYPLERIVRLLKPNSIVACSNFVAATVTGFKAQVCYNPCAASNRTIDAADRLAYRQKNGVSGEESVILFAGRFSEYKGQRELLEAVGLLSDSKFQLWIAGAPQTAGESRFMQELQQRVETLKLSGKVRFLGFVEDATLAFASADIYCQPNKEPEPFGLTYVEALQRGLPVVASDAGGAAEILRDQVNGEEFGVLVPARDTDALAKALKRLIGDSTLRQKLGAKGPRRAKEISDPAKCLLQIERCLHDAANVVRR